MRFFAVEVCNMDMLDAITGVLLVVLVLAALMHPINRGKDDDE